MAFGNPDFVRFTRPVIMTAGPRVAAAGMAAADLMPRRIGNTGKREVRTLEMPLLIHETTVPPP